MANDFTSQYLKERKKSGAEMPKSSDSRSFTEQYLSLRKSPDTSVTPGSLLEKEVFQEIPARVSTGETKREPKSRGGGFGAKESQGRGYFSQSNYSAKDRANDFLQGTLTGVAGSLGNAIGGVLDFADQAGREFLYNMLAIPEEELRERGADTPENLAATELLREIRDRENPVVEGIYDLSDRGIQKGQAQYERSKVGMGPVASTLMDVGRVGVEMGTDALAGALTGGTGLIPMVARSFGGGVSQARANGAEDEKALLAGAAQGGIDYLTERMFGVALPFSKVYGGGSLDDVVQKGISSAVSRFAKTEAGQRALGGGLTLGASALTEGAEEFIADWMGWQLPKIIYDGEVATAEETLSNSLYDFLVGAITGGIGGAVTPATYHYRLPDATTQMSENQETWPVSEPDEAPTNLDAMDEALGGGRADVQSLTPEQIQAWEKRDDIWIDAQDRAYRMDPESHISQRTYDSVRDRTVNAFQFDHPELQPYYREAAEALIRDASLSINTPKSGRVVRGNQGKQYINEILSSPSLRSAMDQGLSRNEVIQAAENLIADHGQENYAAAKRLEFVLDQMLSDGYTTVEGESVPANQEYIRLKESIPGYQEREPLPIWDMDESRGRTDEELAQDMLQVQKAATVLGENGSKALTAAYDQNIARNYSPEQVVEGFYQTYHAVMEGKEATSIDLPEQVKIAAESSAQLDRTRAEQARYFGENSGLVRDQNQKKARLSTQDSRRLDALGKALGVQIRFETSIDDGAGHAANAKYGDGVISLSLDAEDPVFTSVIHEAVHRIRETDPDAYTQLSDLVQTNMTDETMGFSLGSRSQLYGTENRDSLTEELVADAFGRMVRGESLDKLVQDNRTVVQKVLDVIRDIITKIQNALSGKDITLTENQKAEFRDLEDRMGEMERAFREALERQQSREGGQESGETRFSLKDLDLEYLSAVESGNTQEAQRLVDEAAEVAMPESKIRGQDGRLAQVYHGTRDMFWRFDTAVKGGVNGTAEGFGIYTSDNPAVTSAYGDRQLKMFANITHPATSTQKNITHKTLAALIKDTCEREARQYVEDGEYDSVREALRDTWVSNYTDTYSSPMPQVYREVARSILDMNESDMEVIQEVMTGMGIRDYADATRFYENSLIPLTGIDGFVTQWESGDTGERSKIILALNSSQLKSADAVTRDDSGNVIPLSERFNPLEGDIRYSLKSTDSQGRELTPEQQEFFQDSKVRIDKWGDYGTEDGQLAPVYHATWNDEFTVFDRQRLGENTDFNTDDEALATTAHVGFWFNSQDLSVGTRAGSRAEEVYLNITNPYYAGTLDGLADEIVEHSEVGTPAERGEAFRDYLQVKGYDGIILNDREFGGVSFVAFDPEQIKRTTNLNPTSAPDIRYSLSNREQLDQYIQEYGAIPRGERPYREVQIPKRTSETQKVSQTVRTILEAQATPDEAVQSIEELVADGTLSYNPYSDRQAMTDAENTIRDKGYATALSDWTRSVRDGEVSKRLTAEGWELYNQAANAGDMKSAMTILTNMVEHQRNAAQALQATRILKKMSPESQLYGVQRSAQNLTRELKDKYGTDYPDIRIDEELATRFLEAKTDRERDQAMQDLYRDIGRQMPSRFIDKWNAWRYLAMLGNPRTHIRNITGNAFFTPVIAAKDLTATAIESAVNRVSGGKIGRTKGMVTPKDRDILTAAWNDFANSQDRILGGGKYSDSANANRYIQEGRRIFRNPVLERARTANSQALDLEDAWFSKPHYAYALAQYAKANGITAEQIRSGKGLDAARAYAIREAQKATYRDTNAVSEMVSGWGRYRGDNKIRRLGSTVLEGILPFRKTPANILVRGVEYSPLGLLKGLTYDLAQVKKGNMEASTAIDNISAGLTGTGLLTLGVYLAAEGLVRGAGGDDDSEREYAELQGHQAYSLELGDQSFTLDWMAPEALPFFVGVNLWEQTQAENEDVTLSAMLQAVQNITDPILEMSCLQSLNDVFDAVGYASSEDLGALPSILSSAATSYLTQGIPTLLGQAERTGQDVRMTTYTERNAFLTSDMQYTIGRASSRIPGWDYQQIPYIDAWGRTENSGTVGRRAVDNFLNPAYSSTIIESPMEAELERLYEQTGDTGVLPSRAVRYVTVDGERKDLTAEEYVKYAQNKGQSAYNILTELTAGAAYQAATDDVKAEMVDLVYQYSNDTAKASVSNYKPDGWVAKAQAAEKMGIAESQYISLYVQQKSIESLKDGNGETIPDSKGLQIMELVYSVKGLTDKQRQQLFEDFNVGKNVRHFNQTLVKNRLERMRK